MTERLTTEEIADIRKRCVEAGALDPAMAIFQLQRDLDAARSKARAICNEAGFDQVTWGLA